MKYNLIKAEDIPKKEKFGISIMKINVGSINETKVQAVKEVFSDFPEFASAKVMGMEVDTGVHDQPKSLEHTIKGAMNRARNAFIDCDFSVGLESGLIKVPNTKTGYMDVTICAIYDGEEFHLGGSSIFEYPKSIIDLVVNEGHNVSEAAHKAGFAGDGDLGKKEGMIGILTKGKLDRKGYSKQAVLTALIHLLNPEHY